MNREGWIAILRGQHGTIWKSAKSNFQEFDISDVLLHDVDPAQNTASTFVLLHKSPVY